MLLPYKDKEPIIAPGAFIAPTAAIIGDVHIAEGASIWFGAVLRGDMAPIRIGANTNVQDNCTIHTDRGKPTRIGGHVTVGHNAVVHGCTVEDRCLIGIHAVVLSGACIKTGSIIGAGALIKEGLVVGPFQLLTGIPATVKKNLDNGIFEVLNLAADEYLELAKAYRATISPSF